MRLFVLTMVLVLVGAGCMALQPSSGKEVVENLGGTARGEGKQAPGVAGSAQGDQTFNIGDDALKAMTNIHKAQLGIKSEFAASAWVKNYWMYLAIPLALILCIVGFKMPYKGSATVRATADLVDAQGKRLVERLTARRAVATDPAVVADLGNQIIEAEADRDATYTQIVNGG